jgi:hypothetical protein
MLLLQASCKRVSQLRSSTVLRESRRPTGVGGGNWLPSPRLHEAVLGVSR